MSLNIIVVTMLWRHVQINYRAGGIRLVGSRFLSRVRRFVRDRESWLIYAGQDGTVAPEVRMLSFQDLVLLRYFRAISFPEAVRDRPATAYGIVIDGKLASLAWYRRDALELDWQTRIAAPAGIEDCWTDPTFRGRGLYPRLLRHLLSFGPAFISVDPGNISSIRGIERAGFLLIKECRKSVRFGKVDIELIPKATRYQ